MEQRTENYSSVVAPLHPDKAQLEPVGFPTLSADTLDEFRSSLFPLFSFWFRPGHNFIPPKINSILPPEAHYRLMLPCLLVNRRRYVLTHCFERRMKDLVLEAPVRLWWQFW